MIKGPRKILIFLISLPVHIYRYFISPFLRPSCRHVPTCSGYMLEYLNRHGPVAGIIAGTGRILRCRPGGTHGYDPVPLYRFKKYRPVKEFFAFRKTENRLKRE
jgi:putative membrane protein insertion efficiency factor